MLTNGSGFPYNHQNIQPLHTELLVDYGWIRFFSWSGTQYNSNFRLAPEVVQKVGHPQSNYFSSLYPKDKYPSERFQASIHEYISKPATAPTFDLVVKDTEIAFTDIALIRAQKSHEYTVRVVQRLSSSQIAWILVVLLILSPLSLVVPYVWISLLPCFISLCVKVYTRNSVYVHMVDMRHS